MGSCINCKLSSEIHNDCGQITCLASDITPGTKHKPDALISPYFDRVCPSYTAKQPLTWDLAGVGSVEVEYLSRRRFTVRGSGAGVKVLRLTHFLNSFEETS